MLEFIGTVAVCAAGLWLARYLWSFWRFRQSINAVEILASAVKAKADFIAANAGHDTAEEAYFVAICLKSLADSLSYGKIASSLTAKAQLEVLERLISSPADISFYTGHSVDKVANLWRELVRARDSFVLLYRAVGTVSVYD